MKYKKHIAVGALAFSLLMPGSGFIINVKNMKTKILSSMEISTNDGTTYLKNGIPATAADLLTGQKVIAVGNLDPTTNIITAKVVKIII